MKEANKMSPPVQSEQRFWNVGDQVSRLPSLDAALREGPNTLIPPKLAAPILGHSISALNKWRAGGTGPRWVKLSRARVAYKAQDLLDFINSKQVAA